MEAPNLARLVLVLSKRRDGTYEFATGYFVTGQLVLTARHGVPEDAEEVYTRQESTGNRHKAEMCQGKVVPVWQDSQLDALLLRVSPGLSQSDQSAATFTWMDNFAEHDVEWRSTGYPKANIKVNGDNVEFKTSAMKGEVYSQGGRGQGQRELELTVDNPAEVEGWRGISGAPVFVGEKLAGLILEIPDDYNGGRISALPAPILLAVAKFREALEPQWLDWPADQPWMLVLRAATATSELESRASAALRTFNSDSDYLQETAGKKFKEEPVVASVDQALESPGRWLGLVKALCAAPVMIADVTLFQPGVMVALGVRAVVRRAVTLTSTAESVDESHLRQLPFNIQETKLTSYGGKFAPTDPDNPVTVICKAMRDGFAESRMHSRYLDLPAYDAVRCPVPETAKGLQAARESVLVLCSFQPGHSANWRSLSDSLYSFYAPEIPVRMLDLGSPRLVGQALYEYIRWAGTCVVDWTSWRPNVFFELGVRLACSSIAPICVIDAKEASSDEDHQKKQLRQLFQPAEYRVEDEPDALRPYLEQHRRRVAGEFIPTPLIALPHDATYKIAADYFDWSKDETTQLPDELLMSSVLESVGKDFQSTGVRTVLFSVNPSFSDRVRTSMQERWIAAWYYLKGRHSNEVETNALLRSELKDVAEKVLFWIPSETKDSQLRRVIAEVFAFIDKYEESTARGPDGDHTG